MKVIDVPKGFKLVQDSQDISATLESIGAPNDGEFGCLFVEVLDGDYGQVWGQSTFVPYLNNELRNVRDWYGIL